MEFYEKSTVIVGLPESGKSTFAEHLATMWGKDCIVYDTISEWPTDKVYDVYRPKDSYSINELVSFLNSFVKSYPGKKTRRYKYLIIDEANRFAPGEGKPLHPALVELNDQRRHDPYHIGFVLIARRPVQLHPDLVALADNVCAFLLTGKNDIKYLNDLKIKFGDSLSELKPYEAAVFIHGRTSYLRPLPKAKVTKFK